MTTPPLPPSRPDTIARYLAERYLEEVAFTRDEIVAIWQKSQEGAADASLPGISLGGRIKMAFDAQMSMSRAMLWARGLRTLQSDKSHHFRLIDSVRLLAKVEGNVGLQRAMEALDGLRRTRNQAAYEEDAATSEEAAAMMANLAVLRPLALQTLEQLVVNFPRK